jgi:hypothetical protein
MGVAVMLEDDQAGAILTDEELTDLALAADPDAEVASDAVSVWDVLDPGRPSDGRRRLPEWYMPSPLAGARPRRRGWHRPVALLIIASFVLIDALGLCITYGQLVAA